MPTTKDGQHKSSKFRASRYDKAHEGGPRAQADKMQAHGEGNPETHGMYDGTVSDEAEGADPHTQIQTIAAEHGPAHTIHMTHDTEGMRSHVHSIHADGHEHHADLDGPDHIMKSHQHGNHAAAVAMKEDKEEPEVQPNPDEDEESYGEL